MKNITVKDILRECNGKLIYGKEETICENFETDTRIIKNGDVFLGLKGENFDGNQFFETALEKGATVCILQGVEIQESIKDALFANFERIFVNFGSDRGDENRFYTTFTASSLAAASEIVGWALFGLLL